MPKATKPLSPPAEGRWHPAPRPTSVKVGWLEYAVLWIPDKVWRGIDGVSNANIGEHQGPMATIRVRIVPDVVEDYFRETLWHEILHAVWFLADMNGKPTPVEDYKDSDQEEMIIARTSLLMIGVIQQNPEVMAYLGGQLFKKKVDQ